MPSSATSHASAYNGLPMTAMPRSYAGSFHHTGSDRSSRSSSMLSDTVQVHKVDSAYDFNAPMQAEYHEPHGNGYDDMVFPERKPY